MMETDKIKNSPNVHIKNVIIEQDLINANGKIAISDIAFMFQTLAKEHFENKFETFKSMFARGHVWFLLKLNIDIDYYPKLNDNLSMYTWSRNFKSTRAYREYVIECNGRQIIKGQSEWVYFDLNKRLPLIIEDHLPSHKLNYNHSLYPQCISTWKAIENFSADREYTYKLRYKDFDFNKHVNNTRYFEIIEDVFLFQNNLSIKNIKILYKKEIPISQTNVLFKVKRDDFLDTVYHYAILSDNAIFTLGVVETYKT